MPEYVTLNSIMMVVVTLFFGGFLFFHVQKREYFPIKERSAWLSLTMGLAAYVCVMIFFIGDILNQSEPSLQSPVFNQCQMLRDKNDEDAAVRTRYLRAAEERTAYAPYAGSKGRDAYTIEEQNKILSWPYLFCRILALVCYYLRSLKIGIVFNVQFKNKFVMSFFREEIVLIVTSLGVALAVTLAVGFTESMPYTFWQFKESLTPTTTELFSKGSQYFWILFFAVNQGILLFCYSLSRKVTRSYGLQLEIAIIFVQMAIFANLDFLSMLIEDASAATGRQTPCISIGPYPLSFFLIFLCDLFNFSVTIVYPLVFLLGKGIILPPLIALLDYKNFLVDGQYFLIFYNYLLHLQNRESSIEGINHHATSVLTFYMDLKMMSADRENPNYELLVQDYLMSEDSLRDIIPKEHLNQVLIFDDVGGQTTNFRVRENLRKENFEDIYIHLGKKLADFFKDYRKTKSNLFLRQQMGENDKINERMYIMNMIAIDS